MSENKLKKLIIAAKKLAGRPYKYGAKPEEAPRFFDCSGFIQYIYKQIGIELPRSAIEQAEKGRIVKTTGNLRPGDLIFLHGERGHYNKKFPSGIGHVAMYLYDDRTIHTASKRIKEKPKILEKGGVKIEKLKSVIKIKGPITIIKRIYSFRGNPKKEKYICNHL